MFDVAEPAPRPALRQQWDALVVVARHLRLIYCASRDWVHEAENVMVPSVCQRELSALALGLVVATSCFGAGEAFRDDFDVPGNQLELGKWSTEFGPPSLLGRTQLQDWVTPGSSGRFVVAGSEAQLALEKYNPFGFSLFVTHAKTLTPFAAGAGMNQRFVAAIDFVSVSAVAESQAWAMLLAGLGVVGHIARRARRVGVTRKP